MKQVGLMLPCAYQEHLGKRTPSCQHKLCFCPYNPSWFQQSTQELWRKNVNCKIYANSLIGVGVASSFYHASRGRLRKYLRWADYTMIATATVCLSRALRKENPKLPASALFLPIQPLMVSAVHTGIMEVFFSLPL
ncbi:uncharacterized protein LOC131005594 [Salvia miltiorrhiza]|uniref:uncharacterized protein LOC131005594 n=1 Tax=Salvia miltiorrhiza TaxID=226208 RepID=UPI0025AC601C|nr:uncharacterized protein LOC131005594 [Salvia miltiorrhiza]